MCTLQNMTDWSTRAKTTKKGATIFNNCNRFAKTRVVRS